MLNTFKQYKSVEVNGELTELSFRAYGLGTELYEGVKQGKYQLVENNGTHEVRTPEGVYKLSKVEIEEDFE